VYTVFLSVTLGMPANRFRPSFYGGNFMTPSLTLRRVNLKRRDAHKQTRAVYMRVTGLQIKSVELVFSSAPNPTLNPPMNQPRLCLFGGDHGPCQTARRRLQTCDQLLPREGRLLPRYARPRRPRRTLLL
jgi:hypothetical protein